MTRRSHRSNILAILAARQSRAHNSFVIEQLGAAVMPIYEYECDKCHRRTSVLTLRVSEKVDAVCRHCGSAKMQRLMSRFATPKSEEARMDALADPSTFAGLDENDPKSVARMMR